MYNSLEECLTRVVNAISLDPEGNFAVRAKKELEGIIAKVPNAPKPTIITYGENNHGYPHGC